MKRIVLIAAALLLAGVMPATAAPYYFNFCPGGAGCPAGVTEASLSFTENLATQDTNDYILDIVIKGTTSAPYYVDELSFTTPAPTPAGYEAPLPTIQAAPGGISSWSMFYSNVNASAGSCTTNTNNSNEVCLQSVGINSNGPQLQGQTLHWQLLVNLASGYTIDQTSAVNLRAQFLNQDGSNAGILSPNGVPEPTTLAMLGTGLATAWVSRRRKVVRS